MNRDRLRQSFAFLLIGVVMVAFVGVSWAAGVEVEVPYAVANAQWWTGVAIKNLDKSSATGNIAIVFFDSDGAPMAAAAVAPLEPLEIYSEAASSICPISLPSNYSISILHPGSEELAVTVFVGNSATGGFAFQTYNSQVCSQTQAEFLSWDRKLPVNERFVLVLDEEAVLDRETGLVWQRDTSDSTYDWYTAVSYCYSATIGSRKGWRLPTIEELTTLVDPTESKPALPDGHPFTNFKWATYWSSTTDPYLTSKAWHVYFYSGYVNLDNKMDSSYYVRAVRSGQ